MLHVRGLGKHVRVLEADESAGARAQGGTLDLHQGNGQQALKDAGLWHAIQPHLRYEADCMRITDAQGA
jgi:2-polyprenyl-6-methoxyphenol hydroxylase-like FAD-dependent oxidoreductase